MSYAEESGGVLYKNPCLKFLDEAANDFVDNLDNETKATPGRYFIKDTEEVETVYLYLGKCLPGYTQNVRKSLCEVRPGVDEATICTKIDPLTRKSKVDLLKEHISKLQGQQQPQ